jgi:hypothetical protein
VVVQSEDADKLYRGRRGSTKAEGVAHQYLGPLLHSVFSRVFSLSAIQR